MDDYLLFRKSRHSAMATICKAGELFLSAYNGSPRVQQVFAAAHHAERRWLMLQEYKYSVAEYPTDAQTIDCVGDTEANALGQCLDGMGNLQERSIVIDVTGFLNNYVLVLLPLLAARGVKNIRCVYGEPGRYLLGERTQFSDQRVVQVRQVAGFEGIHNVDTANDLLVLGMGYDWRLAAEVAVYKEHARKVQLFGLPSLQPDMYQESLLCAEKVSEEIGPDGSSPNHFQFAPAHDPFVTAGVLSDIISNHRSRHPKANVYLSPLATKAQALGFALYYLHEAVGTATSVIYPVCEEHMKITSDGLSGIWSFDVEFEAVIHSNTA